MYSDKLENKVKPSQDESNSDSELKADISEYERQVTNPEYYEDFNSQQV